MWRECPSCQIHSCGRHVHINGCAILRSTHFEWSPLALTFVHNFVNSINWFESAEGDTGWSLRKDALRCLPDHSVWRQTWALQPRDRLCNYSTRARPRMLRLTVQATNDAAHSRTGLTHELARCCQHRSHVVPGSWMIYGRDLAKSILRLKNGVFWDVSPRGSCNNRRLGGT
jgi:hypothetical protein